MAEQLEQEESTGIHTLRVLATTLKKRDTKYIASLRQDLQQMGAGSTQDGVGEIYQALSSLVQVIVEGQMPPPKDVESDVLRAVESAGNGNGSGNTVNEPGYTEGSSADVLDHPKPKLPTRFHATVNIDAKDAKRLSSKVGEISQEVLQHLAGVLGAKVEISIEIDATIPGGASDSLVRTITENCRTLGFQSHEFEEE